MNILVDMCACAVSWPTINVIVIVACIFCDVFFVCVLFHRNKTVCTPLIALHRPMSKERSGTEGATQINLFARCVTLNEMM